MSFKRVVLLLAVFFFLLAINFFARKRLPYSYSKALSYNQLYFLDEQTRITRIYTQNDSITFEFKGESIKDANLFELFLDSSLLSRKTSRYLTIMPAIGRKSYMLSINGGRKYSIDIDYPPFEPNPDAYQPAELSFEVSSHDILISDINLTRFSEWRDDIFWKEETLDKTVVDKYLTDSIKIFNTDKTSDKVIKIARYIIQATLSHAGAPSKKIEELNPIQQLDEFRSGRSNLWCGNYAYLFTFFATKAGVPVRTVACEGGLPGMKTGVTHVFNEVFLSEENSWAYVDLTMQNIFVKKDEQFLNAIQIHSLFKLTGKIPANFTATCFSKDTVEIRPYNDVSYLTKYYFHNSNEFHYLYSNYFIASLSGNALERFTKFFYSKPYYAVYSDNISFENYQFYCRLFSNYMLALFTLLCIISICIKGIRKL